jgi:hypothetical protein
VRALHEHLEDATKHRRRDPMPSSTTVTTASMRSRPHVHVDVSALVAVARGVVEQVGDDLRNAGHVREQDDRLVRQLEVQRVTAGPR